MLCTDDGTFMNQVRIESHYGQPIFLDQCGKCGAIWFDESELFRARQGEAEIIDSINSELLIQPSTINSTHLCPKDGATLFRFADKHFPDSIVLERCPTCHGLWLNRGEFTRYQKSRFESLHNRNLQDKQLSVSISNILKTNKSGGSEVVLGKLGDFLSTDLRTANSVDQPVAINSAHAVLSVLMTILRLFLRI